jgi:hypothetical protein
VSAPRGVKFVEAVALAMLTLLCLAGGQLLQRPPRG